MLVLAPLFPSINQPWMDTYLEHLLKNGFSPLIYTENYAPGRYSAKVDELGLRNYVIDFSLKGSITAKAFAKKIAERPWDLISAIRRSIMLARRLNRLYRLRFLPSFIKLFRFALTGEEIGDVYIIHSHSETLAFEFLFYALMFDKPLVYTFHGLLPKGVPALADSKRKALYGDVDLVFTNTQFSKHQAQYIGCPENKITVLPQGLPLEDFPFVPRSAPGNKERLILLTVGRYHADKGQSYALLALRRLRDVGIDAQWNFVGVGPDLEKLKAFAEKYKINQHAVFYTELNLEEIRPLYQQSHIFVLPSLSGRKNNEWAETQGVVLQEAQASGCIPIATRTGGIPECLNAKEDAILVRDRSSRAIANAVIYLLERPDEWQRYQENGRRNVEQNFSADVIGRRMAEILSAVLSEKRSGYNR